MQKCLLRRRKTSKKTKKLKILPWWSASCADYQFHSFHDMHWYHTNKSGGILMSTVEPRCKVPDYSTFSSSVFPKLKNAVSSFQQEKMIYFCINRIYSTLIAEYIHEFHSPWNLIRRETASFQWNVERRQKAEVRPQIRDFLSEKPDYTSVVRPSVRPPKPLTLIAIHCVQPTP